MKTYFITLSPLDAYFFGGDITFDSGEKKNYFVRSEVFPQQTSILGMLRYQILVKRNLLSPIPNSKDLINAKKKVGGESFTAGSDMPQSFGYIESISPIFLYHKSDKKPYFIAPLDTFISENKDYKIFPRKSRASFFTLKNETVNPLYELLGTSGDDETPYSSKYELRKGFVSTDQSFSLEADLFINDERVGIIKEGTLRSNKDEGYYRQVYKRMKETDLCFAFYVRLKDGHGITSEEVFLGAERSMFYLNIDEHTSPNTPIEDVFEPMRSYPTNSPAAIARLIAMAMIADGRLDNREIDWINHHDTAAMVGVDRETLVQVLLDCCRDVITEAEQERVFLLEEARLARLADDITDRALQKVALSAMLIIAKADGEVSEGEGPLLRYLMQRWALSLDELTAA